MVSLETNEKNDVINLFVKQLSMHITALILYQVDIDEISKENRKGRKD